MTIRFRCPSCKGRLAAPIGMAGTAIQCPRCKREIVIPSATEPAHLDMNRNRVAPLAEAPRQLPPAGPTKGRLRRTAAAFGTLAKVMALLAVVGWASRGHDAGVARDTSALLPVDALQPAALAEVVDAPEKAAPVEVRTIVATFPKEAAAEPAPPSDQDEEPHPPAPKPVSWTALVPPWMKALEGAARSVQTGLAAQAKAAPPAPSHVKRRRSFTENELRKQLSRTPEVKSLTVSAMSTLVDSYFESFKLNNGDLSPANLLRFRKDLAYLPLIGSNQLSRRDAVTLQTLSRELRFLLDLTAPKDEAGKRPLPVRLEEVLRERKVRGRPEWLRPEAIPVLFQLLMHESRPVRQMLVELLADIPGPLADVALAQRAVVDLAPEVRAAALRALWSRPRSDARRIFLWALRYPWSPLADHAAEALVYLRDQEAVAPLIALLRRPDPTTPFQASNGTTYVREMVRITHETSCLMCHPASKTRRDPVVRAVPGVVLHVTADRAAVLNVNQLPAPLQGSAQGTLQSKTGGGYSSASGSLGPLWIRADVTFFRQDFSVSELSAEAAANGKARSDFLIRTRPALLEELRQRRSEPGYYEQRAAVLWALRELTGKDPGPATAAWTALYPRATLDADTAALADQLVGARGARREQVLYRLRDGKSAANTPALAAAIPRLGVTGQAKARLALRERLARVSVGELAEYLRDDDPEIRRAAALACATKGARESIADLEPLVNDPEPPVAAAARDALRQLKGKEVGAAREPKATGAADAGTPN
jgi:hypothetical protein